MLSLTVKKIDAFKYDGVGESDNTGWPLSVTPLSLDMILFLVVQGMFYQRKGRAPYRIQTLGLFNRKIQRNLHFMRNLKMKLGHAAL